MLFGRNTFTKKCVNSKFQYDSLNLMVKHIGASIMVDDQFEIKKS